MSANEFLDRHCLLPHINVVSSRNIAVMRRDMLDQVGLNVRIVALRALEGFAAVVHDPDVPHQIPDSIGRVYDKLSALLNQHLFGMYGRNYSTLN